MTPESPDRVPLRRLLDAAAADLRRHRAPPLRARLQERRAAPAGATLPSGSGPERSWHIGLSLVVLLAAAAWLGHDRLGTRPAPAATPEPWRQVRFMPLASAERWLASGDEAGVGWIVTGEWPSERLAALGLPVDPTRAAEAVRAELLVHASGELLAVRFLR